MNIPPLKSFLTSIDLAGEGKVDPLLSFLRNGASRVAQADAHGPAWDPSLDSLMSINEINSRELRRKLLKALALSGNRELLGQKDLVPGHQTDGLLFDIRHTLADKITQIAEALRPAGSGVPYSMADLHTLAPVPQQLPAENTVSQRGIDPLTGKTPRRSDPLSPRPLPYDNLARKSSPQSRRSFFAALRQVLRHLLGKTMGWLRMGQQ